MIKTYDFVLRRVLIGIIVDELRRVDLLANATLAFERDLSLKCRENQKAKVSNGNRKEERATHLEDLSASFGLLLSELFLLLGLDLAASFVESTVTLEDSVQVGIERARERLVNESHSVEKDGDESVESRVDLTGIFELRNEGLKSLRSRDSAHNTTNEKEQAYRIMVAEIKEGVFDIGNIVTGDGLQKDTDTTSVVVV